MQNLTGKISLKTTLLLTLASLTHSSFASEEIPANSNLNNFIYPNHTCETKPKKPAKPRKLSGDNDVERYNMDISKYNINVVAYNKKIKSYKTCINQYIKNGNQDINTIRKQLNKALKEARSK